MVDKSEVKCPLILLQTFLAMTKIIGVDWLSYIIIKTIETFVWHLMLLIEVFSKVVWPYFYFHRPGKWIILLKASASSDMREKFEKIFEEISERHFKMTKELYNSNRSPVYIEVNCCKCKFHYTSIHCQKRILFQDKRRRFFSQIITSVIYFKKNSRTMEVLLIENELVMKNNVFWHMVILFPLFLQICKYFVFGMFND